MVSTPQYNDEDVALKKRVFGEELINRDWAITRFMAAVKGLAEVVDYENNVLENQGIPDYEEVNLRKTRGLSDLSKSISDMKRYVNQNTEDEIGSLLMELQEKLHRNSELLKTHLDKVKGLAHIFQTAIHAEKREETRNSVLANTKYRK